MIDSFVDENGKKWVRVVPPVNKPKLRRSGPRRSPKTEMHKARVIEILSAPPDDFDGSNAKLAEYVGLSERQITRVVAKLLESGQIRVKTNKQSVPGFGWYSNRQIYIVPSEKP